MSAIRTIRISPEVIESAKSIQDNFSCDGSAAIGDLVRASATIAGGVDVAADNSVKRPVIGLILAKPSATVATVLLLGKITGLAGLTQGDTLFLSGTGTFTGTVPVGAGYIQILGVAVNTTEVIFSPQLRVVRRNP